MTLPLFRKLRRTAATPRRRIRHVRRNLGLSDAVILPLFPGPIANRIETELRSSQDVLATHGVAVILSDDISSAMPSPLTGAVLESASDPEGAAGTAIHGLLARHTDGGSDRVVVAGPSLLGPEAWGPVDRLRLRPSATTWVSLWRDMMGADSSLVLLPVADNDLVVAEIIEHLMLSGRGLAAADLRRGVSTWPGVDDVASRLERLGVTVRRIGVDGGDGDARTVVEHTLRAAGIPHEVIDTLGDTRPPRRTTMRALAALGTAVGDGDLLAPHEVETLGAFLRRALNSKFDTRATRLSPAASAEGALRPGVSLRPRPTSPGTTRTGRPATPRLLVHISREPFTSLTATLLEIHRDALDELKTSWDPIGDLLTTDAVTGWFATGAIGGRYREFRAAVSDAAATRGALDEDATWIVTIDLDATCDVPGGGAGQLSRSVGARVVDLIDALRPAECSVLCSIIDPSLAGGDSDTGTDDRTAMLRAARSLRDSGVAVRVVNGPENELWGHLTEFAGWVGLTLPEPAFVSGAPQLLRSARAISVGLLLEGEKSEPDANGPRIDDFIVEIGELILAEDLDGAPAPA